MKQIIDPHRLQHRHRSNIFRKSRKGPDLIIIGAIDPIKIPAKHQVDPTTNPMTSRTDQKKHPAATTARCPVISEGTAPKNSATEVNGRKLIRV